MKYIFTILISTAILSSKAQTLVDFYTNYGDFRIELYDSLVPITTNNFIDLVNAEFYDDVIFHRVIDNFMIQGGAGSPVPPTIPDEFDSSLSNVQKTISMANAGPNTGTSQFFINLVNNTYLDFDKPPFTSKHPVFGITISGFTTVQTIGGVATDGNDKPITDVVMDSVRIVGEPSAIFRAQDDLRSISVFPNPVQNSTTINYTIEETEKIELNVYDIEGKLVDNLETAEKNKGSYSVNWDSSSIPVGTYFVRLITEHNTKTKRLIKVQ